MVRHLLNTSDLSTDDILSIVKKAHSFLVARVSEQTTSLVNEQTTPLLREQPPSLSHRRIVLAFFEPSTRTRLSFDMAAHRLGAKTMYFQPSGSSVEKGESLRETILTIEAMGFDAIVLRHPEDGIVADVATYTSMKVINAGEGTLAHPTQALLDASTLMEQYGSMKGLRICIVGDVRHSRVARSNVDVFKRLGAEVAICGPSAMRPEENLGAVQTFDSIDDALQWATVINLLRIQRERMSAVELPSIEEYRSKYALTSERLTRHPGLCVIHPGPVNVGVEIDEAVLNSKQSLIHRQVTHGVAVRMATLLHVLHSES
ncbi:MAG: aspartate carbamoyltransferase catalytic subunit [bacterium]|nr:aspartate carbamoyltransferase catalytic subunit [bacterium]